MIYWQLFSIFFMIGVFCFGGGYAIVPFIQDSVVERGWITIAEFADIIAVSESTPGPISINTATFVGYKLAGVPGAVVATFSLCLPAFILVMTVVRLLYTKRGAKFMDRILIGIRPVVVGMIFFAAWTVGQTAFFTKIPGLPAFSNALAVAVAVLAVVAMLKYHISPIKIIVGSAALGILISFL